MLDSRINQNFNRSIVSPQFRATQNVSKPVEAEEKQGMSTTAKWTIGLGLTALASYGIYALTKGRAKGVTPKPENPIPEIKEMAVNAFKEAGNKFEKGKAILADGTKYTGNITSSGKDGSKVVMEYVDGILQKSTRTAKDGAKVFEKIYVVNNKNEKLVKIIKNEATEVINITERGNIVKEQQGKLKKMLENNEALSAEEYKRQGDSIQYKNKKQVEELNKLVETKRNQEIQQAEQEAQRIAKEVEEKAILKAQQEAEERAKLEAEKLLAKKQIEFEKRIDFSREFVQNNMDDLDKILIDKDGYLKAVYGERPKIKLEELFKPYKGDINEFYHGTSAESKSKILKEGFNQRIAPKHGHLDGIGGTYFSTTKIDSYGDNIITAKFDGKIAEVNTDVLNSIKTATFNRLKVENLLKKKGYEGQEAEYIISEYLKQKLFKMGYQGIIGSNISGAAGCRYFSVLDPKLIKIIS
jgi:hypothetical protein